MKKTLLHRFATLVLLGTFLSAASLAHAQTVTLPQQLNYSGLTFTNPLTYVGKQPKSSQTLSFTKQQKLEIKKNAKKKSLEAIVITPTVTQPVMPTPTIYIQPTATQLTSTLPTPTTVVPATPVPTVLLTPQTNAGGLNPEVLFSMVNTYRQSQGLPAFQKDDKTCSLAASRAPEVNGEIAAGTMHSGLESRNLPYWNTENIISMSSEQAAFTWWINDGIHHAAIVSHNTYSCVACSGNACAEEFTSYQPK